MKEDAKSNGTVKTRIREFLHVVGGCYECNSHLPAYKIDPQTEKRDLDWIKAFADVIRARHMV
jgi:hypothetical protein